LPAYRVGSLDEKMFGNPYHEACGKPHVGIGTRKVGLIDFADADERKAVLSQRDRYLLPGIKHLLPTEKKELKDRGTLTPTKYGPMNPLPYEFDICYNCCMNTNHWEPGFSGRAIEEDYPPFVTRKQDTVKCHCEEKKGYYEMESGICTEWKPPQGTTIVEWGTNNACIRSDKGEPDEPIPKSVHFGPFYDGHCQPNEHSPACALANRDNCAFEEYAFSVLKKRKFQLEAAMSKSQALQAAA